MSAADLALVRPTPACVPAGRAALPGEARSQVRADTSVRMFLAPLARFLDEPGVLEVCINRPGVVFYEGASGWKSEPAPELTYEHLFSLARAVATLTGQSINEERPLLSATLPDGERVQFVFPPACERGAVSVTIRRPSSRIWTLDEFAAQGIFEGTQILTDSREEVQHSAVQLRPVELELLDMLWARDVASFFRAAVPARLTTVVSGATGSGKTTFMKGLIQECGAEERLVTIEDAREILLPRHANAVHLLYSKGDQGVAKVTARDLLVSCLRMRPDRILLAEIREDECYDFLRNAASGHPGSITSLHAGTCAQAFEQMGLMIRQSPAGSGLSHSETQRLLRLLVDVVVQYSKDSRGRRVSEVWYRPLHKKELGRA
ncbi:MAG: P-type DNA transfer ATPase VirB11 [Vitreoscilla sp.]|nr:P-type DNA transfer ATPase VirB11 [Vitreoscilla sp.]